MDLRNSFLISKLTKEQTSETQGYYVLLEILGRVWKFNLDAIEVSTVVLISFDFVNKNDTKYLEFTDLDIDVELCETFTRFSFEFTEKAIPEIYELEWLKITNRIITSCLKINLNRLLDSIKTKLSKNEENFTIELENQSKIDKILPLVQVICNDCYTFETNIYYNSEDSFKTNWNIIQALKTNPLLERIFCLKNFKVDASRKVLTFDEPMEAITYQYAQNAVAYLTSIKLFNPKMIPNAKIFIFINPELTKFVKSTPTESYYISPNKLRLHNKNFSDFITISQIYPNFSPIVYELVDPVSLLSHYDFQADDDSQEYSIIKLNADQNTCVCNYFRFKALRHRSLLSILGLQRTQQGLNLVTEKVEKISSRKDFGQFDEEKKIKVLRDLVKFLIYCQKRQFFYIGLDIENIFMDSEGNVKVLPKFYSESNPELQAPEEKLIGYGDKSEAFRMGLLICKFFFCENELYIRDDEWLTGNIPVFPHNIQEKYSKMVQIIVELTNAIPKYRLSLEKLLLELENYLSY